MTVTFTRWTAKRKAALLEDLAAGRITRGELAALEISDEELSEWLRLFAAGGKGALRVRSLRTYRSPHARGKKP